MNICGESIDFSDNYILTGSWENKDQVKIWDIRMYSLIQTVSNEHVSNKHKNSYIYSCKFGQNEKYLLSTGSNNNIACMYTHSNQDSHNKSISKSEVNKENTLENENEEKEEAHNNVYTPLGGTLYLDSVCYKGDFILSDNSIVTAWGDGCIRMYKYSIINEI